jgi:hypothetical protein
MTQRGRIGRGEGGEGVRGGGGGGRRKSQKVRGKMDIDSI